MNNRIEVANNSDDFIQDIEKIWKSCSWGWTSSEKMKPILDGRWKNFILYHERQPVGYAGVISDKHIYALIVDMMIAPSFQKKGLGQSLVEEIINICKSENIKVIKLISSSEGKKLYQNTGFEICPVDSPGMMMKLF